MLRFVLCHIYHYFSSKEIKWKLLKRLKPHYFLFFCKGETPVKPTI